MSKEVEIIQEEMNLIGKVALEAGMARSVLESVINCQDKDEKWWTLYNYIGSSTGSDANKALELVNRELGRLGWTTDLD